MTREREEAINVLQAHLCHWQGLLEEHICEKEEGKKTIKALTMAIEALQRCQRIDSKLANAVPTKWPAEGFFDFEDDDGEENV